MCAKRAFNREAYYGINFPWFASDTDGLIGVFWAGFTPIPSKVFSNEDHYIELYEYFENLPKKCNAHLSDSIIRIKRKSRSGDYGFYLTESEKGIYVFADDFDDIKESSYVLNAKPLTPLTVTEIPDKLRKLLIRMPSTFSESDKVGFKENNWK